MYRDQVLHHLRFSIEYLRRNSLLSAEGAPQNFAGIVCHLYYTENAAFAFHALLARGYFHTLAQTIGSSPHSVMERLMLVLANIFGRRRFRKVSTEDKKKALASPSVVFLPPLPQEAQAMLAGHDSETKDIFESYVATYVHQQIRNPDNVLPFTGMKIGGTGNYLPSLPQTNINSAFTALSGQGDSFSTVSELCNSVRSGVFLEEAVLPKLSGNREIGEEELLNAYLYDFWKHQDLRALEKDNVIRRSDIWFYLKDFSLVLATIVTSLTSYVKGPVSDMEFLDLQGAGDMDEIEISEDESESENGEQKGRPSIQENKEKETLPMRAREKKQAVADSWEDEADEEEEEAQGKSEEQDDKSGSENASDDSSTYRNSQGDLKRVLRAFKTLQADFDTKFYKMWA